MRKPECATRVKLTTRIAYVVSTVVFDVGQGTLLRDASGVLYSVVKKSLLDKTTSAEMSVV